MVHICVLQTVLDPYKGANHLPLFAAVSDVQFTIICNRSKAKPEDLPSNVQVVTLPGRTGPFYYGFADALFARIVLRKHPSSDPFWKSFDVIHLNQVMGPALRRLRECGVPVLFTIHHPVTVDREVAIQESSALAGLLWRLKYARLIRFQKKMCEACTRVMTVSQTVKERLTQDYRCPAEKIEVVPNGVDGAIFCPAPEKPLFDVIALGSFIHPRKGFRYLEKAYRALAAKGYRIADVGRRSDTQVQVLKSIPGVTVHGTVDQKTVRSLMQRSSVLLSTALYEGFGLSLIEALACGRPAFAFGGGAVPEVLNPIDPSLIVPLRDTKTLVQRVDTFLALPEAERMKKGAQYREAVLARYNIGAAAQQLRAFYGEKKL